MYNYWKTCWPDLDTVSICSIDTCLQWNLFLPVPKIQEEFEVWEALRKKLLCNTKIDIALITATDTIRFKNLLDLHRSSELINFFEPCNLKCPSNESAIRRIHLLYNKIDIDSNGAISAIIHQIFDSYGIEYVKAIFFPRIGTYEDEFFEHLN